MPEEASLCQRQRQPKLSHLLSSRRLPHRRRHAAFVARQFTSVRTMLYSAEGRVSSGCTGTVPVLLYHVSIKDEG